MRAGLLLGISMMAACYRAPAASVAHPGDDPWDTSEGRPTNGALETHPTTGALETHPTTGAIAMHHETEPSALVAMAPPEKPQLVAAAPERKTVWVGGCNTSCIDCSLGSYETYVLATLTRTGERLFPVEHPGPGYSCGAEIAVGERVTLRAHSPTEHMRIVSWTPFFSRDSCPCEGTNAQTCTFTVTPEIASHYDRIYCGAGWKQGATAQIGH